jgi:hypothetical protein
MSSSFSSRFWSTGLANGLSQQSTIFCKWTKLLVPIIIRVICVAGRMCDVYVSWANVDTTNGQQIHISHDASVGSFGNSPSIWYSHVLDEWVVHYLLIKYVRGLSYHEDLRKDPRKMNTQKDPRKMDLLKDPRKMYRQKILAGLGLLILCKSSLSF